MLDRLITWAKGLFTTPVADTRPDSEDATAYAHVVTITAEQEKANFPIQALRGGVLPTDTKVAVQPWGPPPTGYDSWVDVYEGPEGVGYVVNYEITKGKALYRKAVNFGPQTYREQDWTIVADPKL